MSNKEILEQAIQKAIDGGWLPYFAEFDGFLKKDSLVYQTYDAELLDAASVLFGAEARGYVAYAGQYRIPVLQLIFNHDFAKALWGCERVDDAGTSLTAIALWAKQVAIEHAGKVYEVDTSIKHHYLFEYPDVNVTNTGAPTELVAAQKVHYELKDMAGQVPFRTHRITEVSVVGGQEAWQYHLQQMVIANDPIKYLGENLNG